MRIPEKLERLASTAASRCHLSFKGDKTIGVSEIDGSLIVTDHFGRLNAPKHPAVTTMEHALESLRCRPAIILETGTAAWGTQSTILFDRYVNRFGGSAWSIDIRLGAALRCRALVSQRTRLLTGDSVSVLSRPSAVAYASRADLVYLDSWDVDLNDPLPSAMHCLEEFRVIRDTIPAGCLVLIDDTPLDPIPYWGKVLPAGSERFQREWGTPPGKGSLVRRIVEQSEGFEVVMHEYQLLLRKV